jgi:hypothetical protein
MVPVGKEGCRVTARREEKAGEWKRKKAVGPKE